MASNPEAQATEWISVPPEPAELPSRIQHKLEPAPIPAPSVGPSVDRSADTVRPPTAAPKVDADPETSSSNESDVPPVPAAPRLPVI